MRDDKDVNIICLIHSHVWMTVALTHSVRVTVAGCPYTDQGVSVWTRREPEFVGGAGIV